MSRKGQRQGIPNDPSPLKPDDPGTCDALGDRARLADAQRGSMLLLAALQRCQAVAA